MKARRGKIARLPNHLREELNHRLLQNEPASKILPWLNSLPEMQAIIAEMGSAGGHPVGPCDDNNLSEWRHGGYADWLRRRERLDDTRQLAAFALELSKARGASLAEGASAIAAGKLFELLDACADEGASASSLKDLVQSVAALRAGDLGAQRLAIEHEKLKRKDRELDQAEARFQRETCRLFIAWCEDQRAVQAATAPGDQAAKIEQLGQLMFGDSWRPAAA